MDYSEVSFLPGNQPGFKLPYTALTLHALTPGSAETPAHVYCQLDESDQMGHVHPSSGTGGGGVGQVAEQNGNGQINGQGGMDGVEGEDQEENDSEGEEDGGEEEYTLMREIRIFLPEAKCRSTLRPEDKAWWWVIRIRADGEG